MDRTPSSPETPHPTPPARGDEPGSPPKIDPVAGGDTRPEAAAEGRSPEDTAAETEREDFERGRRPAGDGEEEPGAEDSEEHDEEEDDDPGHQDERDRPLRVAVLYNHVGADEFEVLRRQVKRGEITVLHKTEYELEEISTLREEVLSLCEALEDEGYDAYPVNVEDNLATLIQALSQPPPDVVFNLIEWFHEDAGMEDRVAAFYDMFQLPYTGAPPSTLSICQRKVLTKQILQANGLPTPRWRVVEKEPIPVIDDLRYPLIVKPALEDASVGITEDAIVDDAEALERRVRFVLQEYEQPALVEEFIEGRELGVSVLGNDPPIVLPIEEMDFSSLPDRYRGIISFESKWDPLNEAFHKAQLICPADLPPEVTARAGDLAREAYRLLGARDYARVDMRLDGDGGLFILEVNPNPDLTEGVAFMSSAEAAGLEFGETLAVIVECAYKRRWFDDEGLEPEYWDSMGPMKRPEDYVSPGKEAAGLAAESPHDGAPGETGQAPPETHPPRPSGGGHPERPDLPGTDDLVGERPDESRSP